jgi:hypothetical protein
MKTPVVDNHFTNRLLPRRTLEKRGPARAGQPCGRVDGTKIRTTETLKDRAPQCELTSLCAS